MKYLKKGIAEADNEKDLHQQMYRRYYYIRESTFYGDDLDSLIVFPELLRMYEENPGVMPPEDLKYPFEWMVENCSNFYQVSLVQIENYLARYKEFCNKNGITMRTYLLKASSVYETIDLDISAKLLEDMENCGIEGNPRDEIETATKIHRAAQLGDLEKAVSLLNDYLELGFDNGDLPEQMFGDLAYEFAKRGQYKEAEHYASIMMPFIRNNEINSFRQCGYVLALRSVTDPTSGIDLFERCAGIYSRTRNSIYRFDFANGAYRFFEKLAKLQKEEDMPELKLRLSPDFELFSKTGLYDPAVLRDFFFKEATALAEKMDERNKNHYISDMLREEYPEAESVKALELPLHGKTRPLPHIVGLFFRDTADMPDEDCIIRAINEMGYTFDSKVSDAPGTGSNEGLGGYIAYDKYGKTVKLAVMHNNMLDPDELNLIQYVPKELLDTLPQYTEKLILSVYNQDSDPVKNVTDTLCLADKLNTGGAPVIADMNNSLMHPSLWVHTMVLTGECPPTDLLIGFNFVMDEATGTISISTMGMNIFGLREFVVREVPEERSQINTIITFLHYIAEQVIIGIMPDEGKIAPSGMIYDNSSYIRFSWTACSIDTDEDDETGHPGESFAEPVLYLTPADAKAGKGVKLTEITPEDAEKIDRSWTYRKDEENIRRSKGLFPTAEEYFRKHIESCRLVIYASITDEDREQHQIMGSLSFGKNGERLITVDKCHDEEHCPVKSGDTIAIDPGDIELWNLLVQKGSEKPTCYRYDDLYMLLYDE